MPFGAALNGDEASDRSPIGQLALAVCDTVVTAGPLYMVHLRPSPAEFGFGPADRFVAFAERAKLPVRGHTLVWHNMLPTWFNGYATSANGREVLANHVRTVVEHFRGRLYAWDVVNEVVNPNDDLGGLRNSPWLRVAGPEYVADSFRIAREADQSALLGYNEYGVEAENSPSVKKRQAVLALCDRLRRADVPVHYLGIQGHLTAGDTYSARGLGSFLRNVEGLGIKIMISELDVEDRGRFRSTASTESATADAYRRFLDVVMASCTPLAVYTWGLTDAHYWQRQPLRRGELPQRPLPFDTTLSAKSDLLRVLADHDIGEKPGFLRAAQVRTP